MKNERKSVIFRFFCGRSQDFCEMDEMDGLFFKKCVYLCAILEYFLKKVLTLP